MKISWLDRFAWRAARFAQAWRASKGDSSSLANPSAWLMEAFGGGVTTAAGIDVSEETAMRCSTVFACVRVISETVATLPLFTYESVDQGKRKAKENPLYSLLHDQPNEWMTSTVFRETLQDHLCLWGNAYAEIERNEAGAIVGLWPIPPRRVTAGIKDGELQYTVRNSAGKEWVLKREEMLHVPGLGFDGLRGLSPIGMQREAIGLALATQAFGSRFFQNDAKPGLLYMHPGVLSEAAYKRLQEDLKERGSNQDKWWKTMILEEGLKVERLSFPPEEAQFLETRKFQRSDIAQIFRVPLHMIQDLDRSTFSNIEQQSIDFVTHTIRPWLVRWEQEYKRKLFEIATPFFAEHLVDGLLRGDIQARHQAYHLGLNDGLYTRDEVRAWENLNALPEDQHGSETFIPVNQQPVSKAFEPGAPPQDGKQPRSEAAELDDGTNGRGSLPESAIPSQYLTEGQDGSER